MTESVAHLPPDSTRRPPTRRVVLLPDEHFFVRRVPVVAEAEGGPIQGQIELAMEGLAPFPLAQVWLGYWTRPGSGHALVFAAYQKRFGADEIEEWSSADWVAPRFASLLGGEAPEPATTWVIEGEGSLTLVYFDDASGIPSSVMCPPVPAEAPEAQRAKIRSEALRRIGESRRVVDLPAPVVEPSPPGEADFVVRAGDRESRLSIAEAEMIDVRDRAALSSRCLARVRDRWLWRALVAAAAVVASCALGEVALLGIKTWQVGRTAQIARQSPVVQQIMTAQSLAVRIDELSTKRLRPFEMIGLIDSRRPASIQFLRTVTAGIDSIVVSAQTTVQPDIDMFRVALSELPATESVEVRDLSSREGRSTFQLVVTFSPGALANWSKEAAVAAGDATETNGGPTT